MSEAEARERAALWLARPRQLSGWDSETESEAEENDENGGKDGNEGDDERDGADAEQPGLEAQEQVPAPPQKRSDDRSSAGGNAEEPQAVPLVPGSTAPRRPLSRRAHPPALVSMPSRQLFLPTARIASDPAEAKERSSAGPPVSKTEYWRPGPLQSNSLPSTPLTFNFTSSYSSLPRPSWYFFYGILRDPFYLQELLHLEATPTLVKARVWGRRRCYFGMHPVAVQDRVTEYCEGVAWYVPRIEMAEWLRQHELVNFQEVTVDIDFEEGPSVIGKMFEWKSEVDELTDNPTG
jgi:hypothetical protein